MKIVLAPQEFKGSLTASEAARAMAAGIRSVLGNAEIDEIPMADGGPGMVDALIAARHGEYRHAKVHDPIGRTIEAAFGLIDGCATAVVEMAAASGLSLLSTWELDPLSASSFGTGELIAAALDAGVQRLIIGIGGSATNDAGAGMAQALGARLLDAQGNDLPPGGAALAKLERIDVRGLDPRLAHTQFTVACDVRNPLCGPEGASAIYGPQKGASAAMIETLDTALRAFAVTVERDLGADVLDLPGGGAAGGLGAGLVAFLHAELLPGFALVAEAAHLAERLRGAGIVFTGEGRLDTQTAFGKTAAGVAGIASGLGIPTIALVGELGEGYERAPGSNITAAFSIVPAPMSLEQAERNAASYLESTTAAVLRTALLGRTLSPG